jgi:CrcB protein
MAWIYIAAGGAIGALARYGLSGWVQNVARGTFPWGTMTVNVVGSLLLGFTIAWLQSGTASAEIRQFATIGVLGAFTTFSTFSYEAVALFRDGDLWGGGVYVAGSVLAGLLGILAGFALAAQVLGTRGQV